MSLTHGRGVHAPIPAWIGSLEPPRVRQGQRLLLHRKIQCF